MMDNIAILITKLNGGGAERCASNLSLELSKKYNVVLITFDGRNITYPYEGKLIDLKIYDSGNFVQRMIHVVKRVQAVRKIKKQFGIKCTISLLDGPNIINVLSRRDDKVVISVRNRLSGERMSSLRRKLVQICSQKADVTVALSQMVKRDLVDQFHIDPEKITTIYNHCDSQLLHTLVANAPKPDYIDDNSVYIATMGRLNPQKGQWHLIRAFSSVVKEIPNAKLLVIGEGELEEKLKTLADQLGISDHVIFTGYIKNPHILLQYSEMFVFPSLFEGLGNVLLEALAFDMPIISADCVAGPREILAPHSELDHVAQNMELEEYGVLVPVMDGEHFNAYDALTEAEAELAKAIIYLHKNPSLREHYRVETQKRTNEFDKGKIISEWLELIK